MASEKKLFILRSHAIVTELVTYILKIEMEPLKEVIIREYKKDRTVAMNALYWVWNTYISEKTGETKDEVHERHKKDYLVRIYERDNPEYAEMIQTIRNLYKDGHKKDAEYLHKQIVKLTSTTDANVSQFCEYLDDIEKGSIENKIPLPRPEDKYYEAMGIKQGKAE